VRAIPKTIVGDLADWELPALDDLICALAEELAPKRIRLNVDEATFGDLLDDLLNDRLRVLAATAVNELIWGWLEGHADGRPELCTAFSPLKDKNDSEPLTLIYSVAARDGSRAELNRIDLEYELWYAVASMETASERAKAAATLARRLRSVADKLERQAAELNRS
jgi:hypothetical protein